ncbi:hypothetical protein C4K04_2671 [Pseudomonas chlororaphis]|uniref:Uncharacterized protein n=1 Tax=Pseudomonas chlororaphis TaxID=587753 RepID=A0A3G7TMN0_9PSED|nr:hypothetical protein [Pseudomonas chlororaphis]AZE48343.1 hypothetical protein C4K04_2671 [Pseudomonas chlororaphis]
METLVIVNALINLLTTLLAAWLMASSTQRLMLRVIMSLICTGGLADMSALVWIGIPPVWPGETVTHLGIVLVLILLIVQSRVPQGVPNGRVGSAQ